MKFVIEDFDDEQKFELKECIESMSGTVIKNLDSTAVFIVVPPFIMNSIPDVPNAKIISNYWILDCWHNNIIKDVTYFHKPLVVSHLKPLQGCVVTITSYTNLERTFLMNLIKQTGGISQEQLCRVPKDNYLISTHLLSPDATGRKYTAAVKWGIPVINKDWLLECATTGKRSPEDNFSVGQVTGKFI